MGTTLGAMFGGLSILAAKMHVAPYEKGTPTVISRPPPYCSEPRHRPDDPVRHDAVPAPSAARVTPIGAVTWRTRTTVSGRVRSVRVQPWGGAPTLECTLVDATGGVAVVFLGRREIAGIRPGSHMVARGIVGSHDGRLAMLNPDYTLLPAV